MFNVYIGEQVTKITVKFYRYMLPAPTKCETVILTIEELKKQEKFKPKGEQEI